MKDSILLKKAENLLKSNENGSLEKINKKLYEDIENNNRQKSKKYFKDIYKYFLIVMTKMHLFIVEYEKYDNLIEFLDIPGLYKVKDSIYSVEIIFVNFIPMFLYNTLFPIFTALEKTLDNPNVIHVNKYIFKLYLKYTLTLNSKSENISYKKTIYILNKIVYMNKNSKKCILEKFFTNNKHINFCLI